MRRYEVYRETVLPVRLAGSTIRAQTYIVDPAARGYAGALAEDEIAQRILAASGERGPNFDYLERTVMQLRTLRIREPTLERLHARALALSDTRGRIAR